MKFVALISGGKDSIYNIYKCIQDGHELVCLANIYPAEAKEQDSYMYQTVGSEMIEAISKALDVPLMRRQLKGKPKQLDLEYIPKQESELEQQAEEEGDEVEDLYELIKEVLEKYPEVKGVSSGAIASTYQKNRVENICQRLGGLTSLAYLWGREQAELLKEMIDQGMKAILIKTSTLGLYPEKHLGLDISDIYPIMMALRAKYNMENVCGEGGEYESLTLDCPIYKYKIVIQEQNVVYISDNPFSPVAYLIINKFSLVDK